jgi:hypothetical protein
MSSMGSDGKSRLRDWVSKNSYDDKGRAAPSSREEVRSYSFDKGETFNRSGQYDAQAETFSARDARCVQGTPANKAKYIKKVVP